MKKHVKKIAAVLGLVATLGTATAMAIGPWSNSVYVSSIELDPNAAGPYGSSTWVSFTSTPTGMPSCTYAQPIVVGPPDHIKAVTALATSALLAGHSVRVYWNGCSQGYPAIYIISLQ